MLVQCSPGDGDLLERVNVDGLANDAVAIARSRNRVGGWLRSAEAVAQRSCLCRLVIGALALLVS